MSYDIQNILNPKSILEDVKIFLELLEYSYLGSYKNDNNRILKYYWFNKDNYKSWTGIELTIISNNIEINIGTRTHISASFYDIEHQNKTAKLLKKFFGGNFTSSSGKNRYLLQHESEPKPDESGCYLAYNNFGKNLIRAQQYLGNRSFDGASNKISAFPFLDIFNPRLLSNNLILPFLVSIFEDYWKSSYIALLKSSENKEAILKNWNKIYPEKIVQISNGLLSIEEAFAETLSFAKISMVCKHFNALDKKLDFASILRKPYKKRKKTLFDSLEDMTELRNRLIHDAGENIIVMDDQITTFVEDLHSTIDKCYIDLFHKKGWKIRVKTWSAGLK